MHAITCIAVNMLIQWCGIGTCYHSIDLIVPLWMNKRIKVHAYSHCTFLPSKGLVAALYIETWDVYCGVWPIVRTNSRLSISSMRGLFRSTDQLAKTCSHMWKNTCCALLVYLGTFTEQVNLFMRSIGALGSAWTCILAAWHYNGSNLCLKKRSLANISARHRTNTTILGKEYFSWTCGAILL